MIKYCQNKNNCFCTQTDIYYIWFAELDFGYVTLNSLQFIMIM